MTDLPDFYIRPSLGYGGGKNIIQGVACGASAWTEVISITGKGMVYGGYLMSITANWVNVDQFKITIDGQVFWTSAWITCLQYGMMKLFSLPLSLFIYDEVNNRYGVTFAPNITFDSSFLVEYYALNAAGCNILVNLSYGLL